MEQAFVAEAELVGDQLEIIVDFEAVGKLLRRHEASLLQQRQVAIGIVVALQAGIAVPVPGAAESAGVVDHAKIGDARVGQVIGGEHPGPACAEDGNLDLVVDAVARSHSSERIMHCSVAGETIGRAGNVRARILAHAALALFQILRVQRRNVDFSSGRDTGWLTIHEACFSQRLVAKSHRYNQQRCLVGSLRSSAFGKRPSDR